MTVGCTAQRAIDVLIVGGFNQREIDREGAENITIKRTNSAKKKDAASTLRKYPVAARQIRHAVKFGSVE